MRLNSIQFLRALAVLLVVYAHSIDLQMMNSVSQQQRFLYLENFGAIGADLFFVISGFIICYVADKYTGITGGIIFIKKRFLRVNLIYYIASLLTLIPILITYHHFPWKEMTWRFIDTITLIPISNRKIVLYPIITIGWTLGYEWWFYILFFIIIIIRIKNKVSGLFIIILSLIMAGIIFPTNDSRIYFIANPIMLEFLFGAIIYWLYIHITIPPWSAYLFLLFGMAGYIYNIIYGFSNISELVSFKRSLLWGLPSSFIVLSSIFLEKNDCLNKLWNNALMLLIGTASYSIYLLHIFIFDLLQLLYHKIGFFINPDLSIFIQMVLGISIGIIFYKKIENPLLSYLQPN